MKIIIKITKEVLQKTMMCGTGGFNPANKNCGVAYAVREILPDAKVYRTIILPEGNDNGDHIQLPSIAVQFISDFDMLVKVLDRREFLPEISFTIEVPDLVIEKIGIKEATEIISKSSTLELA